MALTVEVHSGNKRYDAASAVVVTETAQLILRITCGAEGTGTPQVQIRGASSWTNATKSPNGNSWRWAMKAGFWAGFVELTVRAEGEGEQTVKITVGPDGAKATHRAFHAMLAAVADMAPSLPWGFTHGLLHTEWSDTAETSQLVRAALLRSLLPAALRQAEDLAHSPPLSWQRTTAPTPLGSRPLAGAAPRAIARSPKLAAAVVTAGTEAAGPRPMLNGITLRPTDSPAMIAVKAGLLDVQDMAENLATYLDDPALAPQNEEKTVRETLRGECRDHARAIKAILNSPLYASVPATAWEVPPGPQDPRAEALLDVLERIRAGALTVAALQPPPRLDGDTEGEEGDDAPSAPVVHARPTFDLYELFCLSWLLTQLRGVLQREGWHPRPLPRLVADGGPFPQVVFSWVRNTGPQDVITLGFQQPFRSERANPISEQHSISAKKVPDFVIARHRDKAQVRWGVLDAKFSCNPKSINDAMDAIAAYRGFLRWSGVEAAGAYILVPALEAPVADLATPDYRKANDMGAVVVRPESPARQVAEAGFLLHTILDLP